MSIPLSAKQFGQNDGSGRVVRVPVSDIVFSQNYLDPKKVKKLSKIPTDNMPIPVGADVGGKVVVQDGHHRTAGEMKRGRKTVEVKVF